jgi:hypothetical protein
MKKIINCYFNSLFAYFFNFFINLKNLNKLLLEKIIEIFLFINITNFLL